jgi:hypothetical protein
MHDSTKRHARSRALPAVRFLGGGSAIILLILAVSGCGGLSGGETRTGWDVGSSGDQTVQLQVSNHNFKDARIYVLWDGERRRLGMVTGNSSETFRVQWRPGATLRIEVDFVAGGGFVSSGVATWPGEALEFVIPAHA